MFDVEEFKALVKKPLFGDWNPELDSIGIVDESFKLLLVDQLAGRKK